MAAMAESRVCFVVTELLGLVRNGGIATATTHAALVLSQHGYDVDLFYCGMQERMEPGLGRSLPACRRHGALARPHPDGPSAVRGGQLSPVPPAEGVVVRRDRLPGLAGPGLLLDGRQASRTRVRRSTRLIHICHGPNEWLREANRQLVLDGHELGYAHMERRSAELADAIVGPSRHLIDWMAGAGWKLAEQQSVIPYFTEGHTVDLQARPQPAVESTDPLTELVFFGRLEERKGVRVFAEALNVLGPKLLDGGSRSPSSAARPR